MYDVASTLCIVILFLQMFYVIQTCFCYPERADLERILAAIPIDFNNNDMEAIIALYWPDAIFIPPGPDNMEGLDGRNNGLTDCIQIHTMG